MGGFIRTNSGMDQLGFVRGPAMLYAAPISQAPPTSIGDILRLTGSEVNEVQTLTTTGTPTGGTFTLTFKNATTAPIAFDAAAATVQAALNALITIGGNVTCTGGPLPTGVVITFTGLLAGTNVPAITGSPTGLTGGTTPTVAIAQTTPGSGLYDPLGSWFYLGGTKNGVVPSQNNAEEEFTIDQQQVAIGSLPNSYDWAFQTSLVEVTPENLAFAWDMGPVTLNSVPVVPEKRVGFGTPRAYTPRRIAIVHQRAQAGSINKLLRAHFFYIMQRSPIESSMTYASTGEQQSVPLRMRALINELVADEYSNVGYLLDQQPA